MSAAVSTHIDDAQRPLLDARDDADEVTAATGLTRATVASTFTPTLGTAAAYGIIISIVIGSGVFTSSGSIDTNVPSPGIALVIWLVGGILAWTGATTMAELGTAIPGEGGVQPYLQYIYGDVWGFLAAWSWIVAVMPATLAILSTVFVESIYSSQGVTDQAGTAVHKILSIVVLILVSGLNGVSTAVSTKLGNFFVGTKFVSIILIVIAAFVVIGVQASHPKRHDFGGHDWYVKPWFSNRPIKNVDGSVTDWDRMGSWELLGHISAAVYGALWAYSGWDKVIYLTAELRNPTKQLPLAINSAIPTIVVCFIAANAAYYILLPWNVVSTSDSVAVTAISRLMGEAFGVVAAVLICLVVAGSLLGNSLITSRMIVAASNKRWLPRVFGVVGRFGLPKSNTPLGQVNGETGDDEGSQVKTRDAPLNALVLSVILGALYIIFGNFRALLTFVGLGEFPFFLLTVVGAIILRFRQPDLRRPYKPFIGIPILFALVSAFVVIRGAAFAPVLAIILLVLWVLGLLIYWIKAQYTRTSNTE